MLAPLSIFISGHFKIYKKINVYIGQTYKNYRTNTAHFHVWCTVNITLMDNNHCGSSSYIYYFSSSLNVDWKLLKRSWYYVFRFLCRWDQLLYIFVGRFCLVFGIWTFGETNALCSDYIGRCLSVESHHSETYVEEMLRHQRQLVSPSRACWKTLIGSNKCV